MKKKVIVSNVIVERCRDGHIAAYVRQSTPKVFDTMEQAKRHIEEHLSRSYLNNGTFKVNEVCRCHGNFDKWLVTAYYDYADGRGPNDNYVQYSACEVAF